MKELVLSCIFLLSVKSAVAGNILYLATMASPSHQIWNKAFANGLVSKRHNVTSISPDADKSAKLTNYTHILLDGVYESLQSNFDMQAMGTYSPKEMMHTFVDYCGVTCDGSLKSKGLQRLLSYPPDFFDLIITDITCGTCMLPLIQKFKFPPTIAVALLMLPPYVSHNFGNQLHPSFIPWYGLPYTPDMSLMERFWNLVYTYADLALRYSLWNKEWTMAKETFGDDILSTKELARHISLVLANTDPLLDYPQPMTPNIIPVGGLHTKRSDPIPQDLQQILDDSKNGVVVFSLGTNVRSDKLDENVQKSLLEAFSKINETVIWKFESTINNLPSNVIVRKWFPQSDMLGHPNVKLFIGHGGTLSTQEALFHGVPMVLIPFIIDQYINTKLMVNRKLGVSVDFRTITTETFLQQVLEVLNNPVYRGNVQKISKMFRDRPQSPLEKGIYWAEFVMHYGEAEFLSTPARDLPFYQTLGLDILAIATLVIAVTVWLLRKCLKFILSLSGSQKKVKKS